MRLLLIAALAALFSAPSAFAMRLVQKDFVCPVDGVSFQQSVAMSGYATESTLDFQQHGMIASPAPLPVCPGNGFAMYKDKFSAEEITRIKVLATVPAFEALRARNNEWLLAAWVMRQLKESPRDIASMYLSATWSAGMEYNQVATEAYDFISGLNDPIDTLILGEWERRLGRFDAASQRFSSISNDSTDALIASGWKADRLKAYIEQQLTLIAAKDSAQAVFKTESTASK